MTRKLLFAGALLGIVLAGTTFLAYTPTNEVGRTESIFVYGTLTNPFIRMITCQCRVGANPAQLANYEKTGRNIVPAPQAAVAGSVITVTPEELANLDRYENVPVKYTRERITTTDGNEHWVYIKTD